jgi:hypothetical protein
MLLFETLITLEYHNGTIILERLVLASWENFKNRLLRF